MRVFYLAEFDCSGFTGPVSHVLGVVEGLAADGHHVWLFASGCRELKGDHIRFVRIPQLKWDGLRSFSYLWMCLFPLFVLSLRERPEFVYTRYYKFSWPLLLLARLTGSRCVIEINSDLVMERRWNRLGRLSSAAGSVIECFTCKLANGIIVVNQRIRSSLEERCGRVHRKITVIPNGVDTKVFSPRNAAECRERLGLPVDGRYVCFVGAFQIWQGLHTLVRAAVDLAKIVPDVIFILVGDGPERPALEQQVLSLDLQGRFVFPGWVSPILASQFIGASDVCVAPYEDQATVEASGPGDETPKARFLQGSPLKVLSFLACARPVVASDFEEAGGFVESIGAGISVPPGDPEALGQALGALLQQPERARTLGRAGRRAVEEGYDWRSVAKKTALFLESLAHGD